MLVEISERTWIETSTSTIIKRTRTHFGPSRPYFALLLQGLGDEKSMAMLLNFWNATQSCRM